MATLRPTGTSNQPQAITSHPKVTPKASKVISTLPETNDTNPKVISMNRKVTPITTATIAAGAKMMRKAVNTVKYS